LNFTNGPPYVLKAPKNRKFTNGPPLFFWDHAPSEIWAFLGWSSTKFCVKFENYFLEMGRVKANNASLSVFTRQQVEASLKGQYGPWFANQTQSDAVMKIWEDNYLQPGAADDDHMAWLQFAVDVKKNQFFTKYMQILGRNTRIFYLGCSERR
jgi:hypothetical protein